MVNFPVRILDAIVAPPRASAIAVTVDPEGNPVELWEPASTP
jgi:predicted enzyme related to lactoylglutathione lyase